MSSATTAPTTVSARDEGTAPVDTAEMQASALDDARPRPQAVRSSYLCLDGTWGFAPDDDDLGVETGWAAGGELADEIVVPFPPESAASGVQAPGYHPVLWYRRVIDAADLRAVQHGAGRRLILHFGAVDHRASVWVDGTHVGEHEGGHTPFSLDITDALGTRIDEHVVVVRAEDDPHDLEQPRGKQDWESRPHAIWYERTSGIWQSVWLESVWPQHVAAVWWTSDLSEGTVTAEIELTRRIETTVRVRLAHQGTVLAAVAATVADTTARVTLSIAGQTNGQGYERLLWRPDSPTLLDAWIELDVDGERQDVVASYVGLRSVRCEDGVFLLNDRPIALRSVLSQGYWPTSHLAAPSPEALRDEVEVVLSLGFNAVRVHQKIEDERFLYWADRRGLLVWGEMPAAYAYGRRAVQRTLTEWTDAVVRDRSHPCIVTWVPMNESWGVQHIAHRPEQRAFAEAMYQITKALDPTRPVISNDGWEHATTDVWTLHDYESDPDVLRGRYSTHAPRLRERLTGVGPAGRVIRLPDAPEQGQPIMLTEFGGVKWSPSAAPADSWGYSEASDATDFADRVGGILGAVRAATRGDGSADGVLAGWCWTQLTDTAQEQNGLLTETREPKLDLEVLRALIRGHLRE